MKISRSQPFRAFHAGLGVLVLALAPAALTSCSDDPPPQETKVVKKRDSVTMKKEASGNEEGKKRREEEARKNLERNRALKALVKSAAALGEAEDGFEIAEALEEIGANAEYAQDYVSEVEPYLTHDDIDVRVAALKTYAKIRGPESRETVRKAFMDDEERIKIVALKCWRYLKVADLAPVFKLLDDFDSDVQYEAVKTLQAADPDAAVVEVLERKAADLDGPAARLALAVLVEHKEKARGFDGVLVALLDHPDPTTRREVVKVTGGLILRHFRVAEKLVKCLTDPDESVRREAHKLLAAWAGADAPAYDPTADANALQAARDKWLGWLATNRSKFGS